MAESNKILTVSYGTFSCTLEGFDDAFTTMKAIAEYFRDLAADDRFFGAEPPTPDPELLAKLASRAAARRVEARQNDTGIVLRQDNDSVPAAVASAPVEDAVVAAEDTDAAEAEAPEVAAEDAPAVAEIVAAEPELDAAEPVEATEDAIAEVTAADDSADDARAEVIEDSTDDADALEVAPEEDAAEAIAETPQETPEEEPRPAPVARTVQARAVQASIPAPRPAPRKKVQVSTSVSRRGTPAPRPERSADRPVSELTSVAAKLQRIRDVVTKNRAAEPDFTEDQHAGDDTVAEADETLLGNLSDVDNTPVAQDTPVELTAEIVDPVEDEAEDLSDDETLSAIGEQLMEAAALDEARDEALDKDGDDDDVLSDDWMSAEDEDENDVEDDFDLSAALAIANAPEHDHEDDDVEASAADAAFDEDDADDLDDVATDLPDASFDDADLSDPDEDAPQAEIAEVAEPVRPARPVARVLKVKRRDFDTALEDGTLEEEDDAPAPARSYGDSSLSPEDEAELQSELMALEQEIAGTEPTPSVAEETAPAQPVPSQVDEDYAQWQADAEADLDDEDDDLDDLSAEYDDEMDAEDDSADWSAPAAEAAPEAPINPRRRLMDRADGDMDRILAETNNQLGDSDGTRRRSAIAHLRAAVAATKAEKQAGVDVADDSQEKADAYRDDLAQVVRPRRPVPRGDTPARRAEDRPAPLKLVAEQRVDVPSASAGPVRPRRVRVADLAQREEEAEAHSAQTDMDHEAEAHVRAAAANAASFTEFADRVGAYEMPDILEAAASYLAFVEGRDEFTRPQLMGKARQALADEFSREDGLRHFGRLLREGKLRKVAAGHFTVSDRINFRPEERAAG